MVRISKISLLLFLIVIFSAGYRTALVFNDGFPPGADIGLHNSLIHSITQDGTTNFAYNYYHMGGGSSNTFPGFHIFVSYVMYFTGLPDYVAQACVAILFSSLLVLVAFLLTRKVLNESVALIVAFLVGFSYYDIYILLWSGYPNIITLALIPLTFYLLLEKSRFSRLPLLAVASLLSAAIFLTHSLSAFMFIAIVFVPLLLALCFPGKMGIGRKDVLEWLVPLIVGGLLVSPFLVEVAPFYIDLNSAVYTGGLPDIQQALLPVRLVPFEFVLPFFGWIFLFFVFFRYLKIKFQFPSILLISWLVISTLLTQSYLAGLYTDYERFLYFASLPLLIVTASGIFIAARLLAKSLRWFSSAKDVLHRREFGENKLVRSVKSYPTNRPLAALFVIVLIVVSLFVLPHFCMPPNEGFRMQSQQQVMTKPGYDALQWIREYTSADSVFVADALYGWWLGGAQRPTVSGVEPWFLTNSREFAPALLANRLLDTDFLIDNGLIQVREDGGYLSRHNPQVLAKVSGSYFPVPVLSFNDSEKIITFLNAGDPVSVRVSDLPIINMQILNSSTSASMCVSWGNGLLNYTEECTVYHGVRFMNLTATLSSTVLGVSFEALCIGAQTRDRLVSDNNTSIDLYDPYDPVGCQLIFPQVQPAVKFTDDNLVLNFSLNSQSDEVVNCYVGAFELPSDIENPQISQSLKEIFFDNLQTYGDRVSDLNLNVFDYRQAIIDLNASYLVMRDSSQIPRFDRDPLFSQVFLNEEVAIFQIHGLPQSSNY